MRKRMIGLLTAIASVSAVTLSMLTLAPAASAHNASARADFVVSEPSSTACSRTGTPSRRTRA